MNSSASSSGSESPWVTSGPDLRKNLAVLDYDSSPALSPQPQPLPQTPAIVHGGQSNGLMSRPISPEVQSGRSPPVDRGGQSPLEGKKPDSPVTTGRMIRSCSFMKLLQSPDPSPSKGQERTRGSLALKRPSFLAYEDDNSSDSGYASLPSVPTEDLQFKRSRFVENPSTEDNVVDNWFSGFGVGPTSSPTLSVQSNASSLNLDGYPLETISELPEEEGGEGSSSCQVGFTSLLSKTLLVSPPSPSPTPTLRRAISQIPAGEFKKPSVPARQSGPLTRSMLKSQNENRKRLVELKEDQPDALPDGSK